MSHLELFRFPLSVKNDGGSNKPLVSGILKESFDGPFIDSRHHVSDLWSYETTLAYTNQRAQTLAALIRGDFHYWNFEDQVPWSVDGVPVADVSDFTSTAVTVKYGTYCSILAANTQWQTRMRSTQKWAAWAWLNTGASWVHVYTDSSGKNLLNGVNSATTYFTVVNGNLNCVLAGRYDDMVMLRIKNAEFDHALMSDYFYDFHNARAWASNPVYRGDFSGDGTSTEIECQGVVNSNPSRAATRDGTFDNNYRTLNLSLTRA